MKYKFVKPDKKYNQSGFSYYGSLKKWKSFFVKISKDDPRYCLSLNWFSKKQINKLSHLIVNDQLKDLINASSYKCPYNGYIHYSLIPTGILTNDPEQYVNLYSEHSWFKEIACDKEYSHISLSEPATSFITNTDVVSLGSGYTDAWNENDGYFDMEKIGINIDNGDTVMFVILRWYNK